MSQPYLPLPPPNGRREHDSMLSQATASESMYKSAAVDVSCTKWTIGWYTPCLIIGCYACAIGVAVGNYFFFKYLDGRSEQQTLHQTYVNWIATAFTRAFSILLGAALCSTYTQLLWRVLRGKSLSVTNIDRLFSLASSPLQLRHSSSLLKAPVLWLFGTLIAIIPLAAILPPGANIVVSCSNTTTNLVSVPMRSLSYPGGTSYTTLNQNALFQLDSIANYTYRCPTQHVSGMIKSVLLGGKYIPFPSPCGANCSYAISVPGPTFDCQKGTSSNLERLVTTTYGSQDGGYSLSNTIGSGSIAVNSYQSSTGEYLAAMSAARVASSGQYVMELKWASTFDASTSKPTMSNALSCTARTANYTFVVSYLNGVQTVSSSVARLQPLNSSMVASKLSLIPSTSAATASQRNYDTATIYESTNIYTMVDAFLTTMIGAVSGFGTTTQAIVNTNLLQTPFAQYIPGTLTSTSSAAGVVDPTTVHLNISPETLNSALTNITLSLLSIPNTNVNTMVTTDNYQNYYSFKYPIKLLAPYGAALVASAIFITVGLVALLQNGVSASTGGFLQILVTTRGSSRLDELAKASSIGGDENVGKELGDLKIQFGEMRDDRSERWIAGFGIRGEIRRLVKGRNYSS